MTQSGKTNNIYPKVKVRVQRDDADRYAFERSSLQSLKAFEWLSLNQFSSDEAQESVARIPRSYVPLSPPPSFYSSKVDMNQNKERDEEENRKNTRASSAPRPRAVLSSPDNDVIIGGKSKTKTKPLPKKELLTGSKNHNSCQNRHTQCKIFPKSAASESLGTTRGQHDKGSTEFKINNIRSKGRTTVTDPGTGLAHHRKITPASGRH